ncbi:MAG TPA: hypothetical protein PLS95_14020 [Thermoanaerobaculales bacterium]|nr:hypothetical protein [Thermoanaerobaculales bacterium]
MSALEDAFSRAAQEGIERITQAIAADARAGYAQHELQTADPRMGVIVEPTDKGFRCVTYNPFSHLDEYGGGHSTPTGAMRSAAARHGRFTPE